MTPANPNGEASPLIVPFHFPDFAVSWAGPGRRDDELCFGSEDGRLLFTTQDGLVVAGLVIGEGNLEAVNGVAVIGAQLAVSTRNEITLLTLPQAESHIGHRAVIPCGAHSVIATAEGYFIAPLGRNGLMKVLASRSDMQQITVSQTSQQFFDYYKAISLHALGQPEIIVCAVRQGGMLAAHNLLQDDESGLIDTCSGPDVDIVDVCTLCSSANPFAHVGIGRNGFIALFKDVSYDQSPVTMKYDDISGVAYRIFCAQKSLILLTSSGLYVLKDMASRFLAGEPVDRMPTPVIKIPLEAVDANLCGERWLLVVMPDGALRIDLNLLLGDNPTSDSIEKAYPATPTILHPAWQYRQESSEQFAIAQ